MPVNKNWQSFGVVMCIKTPIKTLTMSIKSFANGVIVGLVLGVLFAPDSGNETRKKIAKKAGDIKDTAVDKYNDIADTVADQYGRLKTKAQNIMGKGEEVYNEVKAENNSNMFE